jgi:hypothetical protein
LARRLNSLTLLRLLAKCTFFGVPGTLSQLLLALKGGLNSSPGVSGSGVPSSWGVAGADAARRCAEWV